MIPKIQKVDHIHLNVKSKQLSEEWYERVLGFKRVKSLEFWSEGGGPLTISSNEGGVHLALFESSEIQATTIALATDAQSLIGWVNHLRNLNIGVKPIDHDVSWSIYFEDLDGNPFEITTYEYNEFASLA